MNSRIIEIVIDGPFVKDGGPLDVVDKSSWDEYDIQITALRAVRRALPRGFQAQGVRVQRAEGAPK